MFAILVLCFELTRGNEFPLVVIINNNIVNNISIINNNIVLVTVATATVSSPSPIFFLHLLTRIDPIILVQFKIDFFLS